MIHVDTNIPLVTDHPEKQWTSFKPVNDLAEGDVIAVPFGDTDVLCRIKHVADDGFADVTDGALVFIHELPHDPSAQVRVYAADRVGEVRR